MKTMVRVLLPIIGTLLSVSSNAQFIRVIGGVVAQSTRSASLAGSYDLAGGGVVLRGVASCSGGDSACNINSVAILASAGSDSRIQIETESCTADHVSPSWLLKDAVRLVSAETGTIYRNVNLLSDPTDSELIAGHDPEDYFHVEVSKELIGSRSGEVLLAVDLMLTDPGRYSLFRIGLPSRAGPDPAERDPAPNVVEFIDAFSAFAANIANWTWNDKDRAYTFVVSCDKRELRIKGSPTYTFLDLEGAKSEAATTFFRKNSKMIYELNPAVFANAIEFSRVTAFLRHVRASYPAHWNALVVDAAKLPTSRGTTPRLIPR